jgi:YVTN family beta-propeller protein
MSDTNGRSPQAQIVVDAIERLPPTEHALLQLSVRHRMDDAEIGALVGLDEAEVNRLRLGVLERMTSELAEAGLGRWGALGAALNEIGAQGPEESFTLPTPPRRERRTRLRVLAVGGAVLVAIAVIAVSSGRLAHDSDRGLTEASERPVAAPRVPKPPPASARPSTRNIYAATGAGMLSPVVERYPPLVYVPNSRSNTVDVIDPHSYRVVEHFNVGLVPQHVTPSWDLKTLWVDNDVGNSLTPIDPSTGRPGRPVHVDDPYNLYFTPDGKYAIVVAEQLQRLDFRKAHSMKLHRSVQVPCLGVDHMDFTADGRFLLASCEFAGKMIVVDVKRERLVRTVDIQPGSMPQDVKLSPDGRTFYVADMAAGGVWLVGAGGFRLKGFLPTGRGAHGLYASRDARRLYVSNRSEGSISVISFRKRRVVTKWTLPGGGSPDMGGVSTDGKVLWLTGRYDAVVYAISTKDGHLIKKIPVGLGPHGLCVYPQPGRYSLGHTGVFR